VNLPACQAVKVTWKFYATRGISPSIWVVPQSVRPQRGADDSSQPSPAASYAATCSLPSVALALLATARSYPQAP
jgi:hypothetical protein